MFRWFIGFSYKLVHFVYVCLTRRNVCSALYTTNDRKKVPKELKLGNSVAKNSIYKKEFKLTLIIFTFKLTIQQNSSKYFFKENDRAVPVSYEKGRCGFEDTYYVSNTCRCSNSTFAGYQVKSRKLLDLPKIEFSCWSITSKFLMSRTFVCWA